MFCPRMKKLGTALITVLSMALLIHGCGGGGGPSSSSGGGTPTATTGSKAAATGTAVTNTALSITSFGLSGGALPSSISKPSLNRKLGGTAAAWKGLMKAKSLHATTNLTCSNAAQGGTGSTSESWVPPTLTTTTTASNCVVNFPGPNNTVLGSFTFDGTMTVQETDNNFHGDPTVDRTGFNPSNTDVSTGSSGFSFTQKDASGVITSQFGINGQMVIALNTPDSFGRNTAGTVDITAMTLTTKDDNGTPTDTADDHSEVVTVSNLHETILIAAFASNDSASPLFNDATDTTNTIVSGTIAEDDLIDNTNDISVTFNNLIIHEQITEDTDGIITADTVTINGKLSSPCLGGEVTLATTTPIDINSDGDCPIGGVMTVTGATGTATVTFTSTGGVHVVNPDGTAQDFAKCNDAKACS